MINVLIRDIFLISVKTEPTNYLKLCFFFTNIWVSVVLDNYSENLR